MIHNPPNSKKSYITLIFSDIPFHFLYIYVFLHCELFFGLSWSLFIKSTYPKISCWKMIFNLYVLVLVYLKEANAYILGYKYVICMYLKYIDHWMHSVLYLPIYWKLSFRVSALTSICFHRFTSVINQDCVYKS